MDHELILVDVFTDKPFSGNQLAVFPEARGLSDRAMQALAREINLAETTFGAAALAGALAARVSGMDADVALDIAQGVAMGRPSRIHASATKRRGIVDTVAGSSVIVGRGTMHVPDGH